MKLLVTGGLGYVGGRFAGMLAANSGIQLTLTTRRDIARVAWAPAATVAMVDPGDEARLARLCQGVDAVVHLSGMNAAECKRDPAAALAVRVLGITTLLRAAASQGVARLIYVSTAHVYGAALSGTVTEQTAARPDHPYGVSHLAAEQVVRSARPQIDGIVARLSNTFGAPIDASADCWSLVTNDLCRQAVNTRRIELRTAGRQHRDFIAMSEACRALLFLCRLPRERESDATFNIGGDSSTLIEVAGRIATRVDALLGFRPEIHAGTAEDTVGTGDLAFRSEKLRAAGFEPDSAAPRAELDELIYFCARNGVSP